jgi:hypothetical protein
MAFAAKQEAPVGLPTVPDDDNLHLRKNAERILHSTHRLDRKLDPRLLPIAGLRSAILTEQEVTKEVTFREVLNPIYRPVVIFDLDDIVWPHAPDLLRAISHVTGVGATDEDLQTYGHTRRIPQWQTPGIDAIQDEIQANRHPDVNPFVNRAYQRAVETIHAVHAMGHLYTYFTGRMSEMFATTKRVIEWNGLPIDPLTQHVDARTHPEPKRGYLYCSWVDPKHVDEYKNTVMNSWLRNLRSAGWRGRMIIVDDTPKAFKNEIENGDVVAIALDGPLNHNYFPFQNEIRVADWDKISEFLAHYHGKALIEDPSPVRIFDCRELPDTQLVVQKDASGVGYFKLEDLPRKAYDFIPKITVPGCS